MAAGGPVGATETWGHGELGEDGQTGFVVPVGERAGLARYAHKILEDPELGRRLGTAGRQRILADFTVESMVEKHAALYRELLG